MLWRGKSSPAFGTGSHCWRTAFSFGALWTLLPDPFSFNTNLGGGDSDFRLFLLRRRSICTSLESAMMQHVEAMGILDDRVPMVYQSPEPTCQKASTAVVAASSHASHWRDGHFHSSHHPIPISPCQTAPPDRDELLVCGLWPAGILAFRIHGLIAYYNLCKSTVLGSRGVGLQVPQKFRVC